MLAPNFKTAEELGIDDVMHAGLVRTLHALETGEIKPENFNMGTTRDDSDECGTVCCIGGWACTYMGMSASDTTVAVINTRGALQELFFPTPAKCEHIPWHVITIIHGTAALRNYLVTGRADWESILKDELLTPTTRTTV